MAKSAKIDRAQKAFVAAMKQKFAGDSRNATKDLQKSAYTSVNGVAQNLKVGRHVTLLPDRE